MTRPGKISTPRQNRAERGIAIAPILYLLGLIGIASGILFSNYSQVFRSTQTLQNTIAAKSDLQAAATTLAATSWLSNDKTLLCPPLAGSDSPETPSANCSAATNAITVGMAFGSASQSNLPADYASITNTGAPVEVGVFAAGHGQKSLDPWGHYYLYCRWENPIGGDPAYAIISAGPNGKIETACGSTSPGGDDLMIVWSTAVAQNRAAVWQTTSAGSSITGAQFGATGSQVSISTNGNVTIPGTLAVLGTTSLNGGLTGSTGSFTTLAVGGGSQMTVDALGNITTAGSLGVSGPTILDQLSAGTATLSSAAITSDASIGGALGVTGPTTLGSTSVSSFSNSGTSYLGGTTTTSTAILQIGTSVAPAGSSTPLLTIGKLNGAAYPFTADQYGNVNGSTFSGSFQGPLTGNVTGSLSGGSVAATNFSSSGTFQVTNASVATFSGAVSAAGGFQGNMNLNGTGGMTFTGTLPIQNGGTAANSAAGALINLFSGAGTLSSLIPAADLTCCLDSSQMSATGVTPGQPYSTVIMDSAGRVVGGTMGSGSASQITDGGGDTIGLGSSVALFTIGNTIQGNWTASGLMVGSSKQAVNKLDVYGAEAIGTSYAGVYTAPPSGLIVQGNVGIGTTNPGTNALQVNGTIVATGFVGNGAGLTGIGTSAISGILGTTNGGTGTGITFTPGSVVFAGASGIYAQDNTNFFWDATNHRLGIGTSSASSKLTIGGAAGVDGIKFPDATTQTTGVPTCPLGDNPVSCGTYWVCSSQRPASCFTGITIYPATLTGAVYGSSYDQILTASGGAEPYSFTLSSGSLPNGLSLSSTGLISGTPIAAGTSSFTITATDGYSNTGSQAYTLTIAVPTITLSPIGLSAGSYGSAYSQTISASGGISPYVYSVISGSLPTGLSLNTSSGLLSGTPVTTGTSGFTITATDAHGYTGRRAYSLTIAAPTISLSPSSLPNGTYNVSYSQTVSASGGVSPYTYSIPSGSLPGGLTITSSTGAISGTPITSGTFNFTVTATDAHSYTGSQAYSLTIAAPTITLSPTTLPVGTQRVAYLQSLTASGGVSPYTYSLTSGSLPSGITLSSGGIISGSTSGAGSFPITVTATDAHSQTGSQSYTLTINGVTITISPGTLPGGTYAVSYSQALTASGGASPYTYAVTSGALPAGLSLGSGTISGTPAAVGTSSFTITATDANSNTGSQAYGLTISAPTITLSPSSLPNGAYNTSYSQVVSASGGISPYTYSITNGSLPGGISINSSSGAITGTPTTSGGFMFTVTATDAHSFTGSQSYVLTINAPTITLSPTTLPVGTQRVAYSQSLTASGGVSPYSYSLTSGSLPAGITLSSGGTISGSTSSTGSYPITVKATDTNSQTGSQSYTLTINGVTITISPSALPNGTYASAYSQALTASGGASPYTYAVTSGALPNGLSLSSGTISGTPTAVGTSSFTVTATDTNSNTGSQAYSLTIAAATITVSPSTLTTPTYGSAYSQTVSASGGISPYTYSITSGSLPGGLSINSSTGVISGTPVAAGSFSFTVTATDAHSQTGSRAYSWTIAAPTIALSPSSPLPGGTKNVAYSQTVSASGGISPYTYSITSGSLPGGLSINSSTGVISGTPTATGTASFTVTATDAHGYTGSRAYSLTISAPTITLSPASPLTAGTYNTAYSQTITASGGTSPYTYAVTSGSLPSGITLSSAGSLSGTPLTSGAFSFTITATDANSNTGSQAYSLTIAAPAITVSPSTLPTPAYGLLYFQIVSASGGISPYTYSITSGSLPTGMSLNASMGTIIGMPTVTGAYSFTITATDAHSQTGSQAYSGTIAAPTITLSPSSPLTAGTQNSAYSQTITASGGASPYTYAVTSGSLPAGLSLSSGGILSGTPTGAGTSSFTVTASDVYSQTGSQAYSLTINAACGGTLIGGYCWYYGGAGQSCDTVCASHGGYNAATLTYTGTSGTNAQCQSVLTALSAPGGPGVNDSGNCYPAYAACGCGYYSGNGWRLRCLNATTTSSCSWAGTGTTYSRACACNN